MAGLFELQLVQNMRRWGRNITRWRSEKENSDAGPEEMDPSLRVVETKIQFKPRGLQRMGLTWRRRRGARGLYTEEDALSAVELNGVPRKLELGRKQVITP